MNRHSAFEKTPLSGANADPALLADLRLRFQGSHEQEQAARAETRRLARELALARRLLKFSFDGPPPPRPVEAAEIPRAPGRSCSRPR